MISTFVEVIEADSEQTSYNQAPLAGLDFVGPTDIKPLFPDSRSAAVTFIPFAN
jgi:hypothetical protein